MAVWDGLQIGGPPIPASAFEDFYEADFTKPFNELFSTEAGWNKSDADWKYGGYLKYIQSYATSVDDNASNQRNFEGQHYYDAYGDRPDPFELVSRRNGHLILGSRETTEAEAGYSRVKGYYTKPDGQIADRQWFVNNYPGGVPEEWLPQGNQTGILQFLSMPSSHVAPMISQFGRRSMSFGEVAGRFKFPQGATGEPGFETDWRKIKTVFSAFWDLQAIVHRADLNGMFIGNDTHTPGNQASTGIHPELDVLELFGYDKAVLYQTMHFHIDGNTKTRGDGSRYATNTKTNYPGTNVGDVTNWMELRIQRTPGKIVFVVNDKITNMIDTPASIRDPLPFYVPEQGKPYEPQLNADFTVQTDGIQVRADGSPIYMQWSPILNMAFNARFTRGLARSGLINNPAAAAPYSPENEIEVDWFTMRFLGVDNPDQKPTTDYTAGETGLTAGSSQGVVNSGAPSIEISGDWRVKKQGYVDGSEPSGPDPFARERNIRIRHAYAIEGSDGYAIYQIEGAPPQGVLITWDYSSWGSRAQLVGLDTGPTLKLRIIDEPNNPEGDIDIVTATWVEEA